MDAVFVTDALRPPPDRNNDVRLETRFARVQVTERDHTASAARALASAIANNLQGADLPGFLDVRSLQSTAVSLYERRSGLHKAQILFELVCGSIVA